VVLVLGWCDAAANMGNPSTRGGPTSEPGGLRSIVIVREDLRFDLRNDMRVEVAATYEIDNKGPPVTERLVFVVGGRTPRFEITIDDTPVPAASLPPAELEALPAHWRIERSNGEEIQDAYAYTLSIPTGAHRIVARYPAIPSTRRERGGTTLLHEVSYVLAPARDWGGFEKLDVTIEAAPGWDVETSLPFSRTGDTLRGTFTSVPADFLLISYRAPVGTFHRVLQFALPIAAVLVLVGGGFLLFRIGRSAGRARPLRSSWILSLLLTALWTAALVATTSLTAMRNALALPPDQDGTHGDGLRAALVGFLFLLVGLVLGLRITRAGVAKGREALTEPA
jgi:hypothetical protein